MKTKVTIAAISVCGLGSCLVFYFVLSQSSKPENKGSRSGHTQQSKTDGKPSSQSTGGGKGNPGITNPNTRVGSILSDPRNANLAELDWEGSSEAKALFENGWTLLQAQGYKDARQLFEKIYADAPDTELGKLAYWSVAFCMYGDGRNEVGCADAAERFKRSSNLLDSDSKLPNIARNQSPKPSRDSCSIARNDRKPAC